MERLAPPSVVRDLGLQEVNDRDSLPVGVVTGKSAVAAGARGWIATPGPKAFLRIYRYTTEPEAEHGFENETNRQSFEVFSETVQPTSNVASAVRATCFDRTARSGCEVAEYVARYGQDLAILYVEAKNAALETLIAQFAAALDEAYI